MHFLFSPFAEFFFEYCLYRWGFVLTPFCHFIISLDLTVILAGPCFLFICAFFCFPRLRVIRVTSLSFFFRALCVPSGLRAGYYFARCFLALFCSPRASVTLSFARLAPRIMFLYFDPFVFCLLLLSVASCSFPRSFSNSSSALKPWKIRARPQLSPSSQRSLPTAFATTWTFTNMKLFAWQSSWCPSPVPQTRARPLFTTLLLLRCGSAWLFPIASLRPIFWLFSRGKSTLQFWNRYLKLTSPSPVLMVWCPGADPSRMQGLHLLLAQRPVLFASTVEFQAIVLHSVIGNNGNWTPPSLPVRRDRSLLLIIEASRANFKFCVC